MKKYVKLFEDFDRNLELDGFKFIKKISTDDFMEMLRNKTIERGKNYVYRLINYKPNADIEWVPSGEMMKPIVKGDKKSVAVIDNNMYNSPFIVYPDPLVRKPRYFVQTEDGKWLRYGGSSKKIIATCEMMDVPTFHGISFSAFFGNRTNDVTITDTDYMKLVALLTDVFDNEKRHDSWIKSTRNYTGYIFDEVYVYEIEDPEVAVDTIIEECNATIIK